MQKLNHTKKACLPNRQALTIIIIIVACITSFAQNRNTIDSLKNIVNNKKAQDTTIIQAYFNLSCEYLNYNLDTALIYVNHAIKKSLNINYKKGIADSYRKKGEITTYLNNYKLADSILNAAILIYREINLQRGIMKCYINLSANSYFKGDNRLILNYCTKALKIAEDNNYNEDKANIFNNIGIAYLKLGDYEKAIENWLLALKIYEQFNDIKMIAGCNINIGVLFMEINDFDNSLEYMNKALELCIKLDDTRNQSVCLKNIGSVYYKQKRYNEALKNYNKSLELEQKNNNLDGISTDYNNLGSVYYELKKFDVATKYFTKSRKIYEQLGNKRGIAHYYLNIAKIETKLKKYILAEEYCLKSIELFEQINEPDKQQESLEQLTTIYKLSEKYKKAFNTHIEASTLKDSLFNIEKAQKIAQLEEKYLNEKLEKQNLALKFESDLKQTEISQQKKLLNIYLIAFILSVIAISIILIQFRKKNIAYKFLVKKNLDLLSKEQELKIFKLNKSNKQRKITVTDNIKEEILEKLEQLLDNEKVFRDFDLTIDKLAKSISTNRNYLSQTIYKEFGKNFNDFINEYRVKEVMLMFSNPKKNSEFSIAGIANEVGFRAISSFIHAFKKYTGITPSEFRHKTNSL
ncbi:MAG: tetratricopeptide repeat protein [Bacteroidales bacterium]|nr:tetratricopeptide repeat protein [Bacteroidales bacterium]